MAKTPVAERVYGNAGSFSFGTCDCGRFVPRLPMSTSLKGSNRCVDAGMDAYESLFSGVVTCAVVVDHRYCNLARLCFRLFLAWKDSFNGNALCRENIIPVH